MKSKVVKLPKLWFEMLGEAVEEGLAGNQSIAIRDAVRDYLKLHNIWKHPKLIHPINQ